MIIHGSFFMAYGILSPESLSSQLLPELFYICESAFRQRTANSKYGGSLPTDVHVITGSSRCAMRFVF